MAARGGEGVRPGGHTPDGSEHNPAPAAAIPEPPATPRGKLCESATSSGAVYLGSHLGPGPRDGLITGLVNRTGRSVRLVRTSPELTVLLAGCLLGGTVGVGTIFCAVAIGPLIQFFPPRVAVPIEIPAC